MHGLSFADDSSVVAKLQRNRPAVHRSDVGDRHNDLVPFNPNALLLQCRLNADGDTKLGDSVRARVRSLLELRLPEKIDCVESAA